MLGTLVEELPRRRPALLVVEDLHWADEATLDVVRLLGRRLDVAPARSSCSATATSGSTEAIRCGSCSATCPRRARRGSPCGRCRPARSQRSRADEKIDSDALARRTGGNPFFVTEVLAARGAEIPATVRDAVLGRAARLGGQARRILDAVSIFPPRAELSLLEECVPGYPDGLDECLAAGMLHPEGAAVAFRHEIARFVLDAELPPHERVTLHRAALLSLSRALPPDPARLAYHAEGAGDREAVLHWAPLAAERAAALGSHREAAQQYARALREADALGPEQRAELHERRSYECYLTDQMPEALDARLHALTEHRRRGDRLREGDAHRWVSRLRWFLGENEAAEREAQAALDLLDGPPPGPELAMAYSNMSQLRMLARDSDAGIAWGERAIALAERLGEDEILVHALNNVGASHCQRGDPEGRATLERSLDLALAAGLEEHAARAYTNLASQMVESRDYAVADAYLERGIAYCREHDVDSWRLYMTGWLARSHLDQGRWDEAADAATTVLRYPNPAAPSRIKPLTVVGRLRARRGDPEAWESLDEALRLAEGMAELQRLAPVAVARAEARWLDGELELVAGETGETLAVALESGDPWAAGELAMWRRRAGVGEHLPEAGTGRAVGARARRRRRGRRAVLVAARLPVRGRARTHRRRDGAAAAAQPGRARAARRDPDVRLRGAHAAQPPRRPRPGRGAAAGDPRQPGRPHRPRARRAGTPDRRAAEPRDRRPPPPVREDGPPPRLGHPAQAGGADAGPGGSGGVPAGHRKKIGRPPDVARGCRT